MTNLSQFPSAENMLEVAPAASRSASGPISSMAKWIGVYIETMADYYAAAATYEQLSRLSDAELQRRGLSRATLARDICQARNRAEIADHDIP